MHDMCGAVPFLLSFCLFCALPPLEKFFTLIIFLVAEAFYMLYLGQNHAWLSPVSTSRVFESTNYKHENTGTGHNF